LRGQVLAGMSPTRYRYVAIDDLNVFYRDTGPSDAPAVLLLHGFPSSSRMWQPLIDRLGDRYRMVAPDYPGFGHSDAPPPDSFSYTFDHIADYVERLTDEIGLTHYSLVMQDYGGPVGMRLAVRRPERISALIVHNAVCHEDGLGPLWETPQSILVRPSPPRASAAGELLLPDRHTCAARRPQSRSRPL
jgi:pimeloyl-ACP methyl ester carboxylesterase